VASGAVSQLVRPTGEKKRARGKHRSDILIGTPQKKILKEERKEEGGERMFFIKGEPLTETQATNESLKREIEEADDDLGNSHLKMFCL